MHPSQLSLSDTHTHTHTAPQPLGFYISSPRAAMADAMVNAALNFDLGCLSVHTKLKHKLHKDTTHFEKYNKLSALLSLNKQALAPAHQDVQQAALLYNIAHYHEMPWLAETTAFYQSQQ